MRNTWALVLVGALVAGSGLRAAALPITYTETFTGSGTLGATAFTNQQVIVTSTADTASVGSPFADTNFVNNLALTFQIGGLGTFTATSPTSTFDNRSGSPVAGFATGTVAAPGLDLLYAESNAAFATYDLKTAIGPLAVSANPVSFSPVATTGGALTFTPGSVPATFTAAFPAAAAVPEPSTAALGLLALPGLGWWMMKKRQPAAA